MKDQGQTAPAERDSLEVVRDSTFMRFVADEAVVSEIGRDLEVGFLQYGPIFVSQTDLGSTERTDTRNVVTEVARMRMGQAEFLAMAMNYIRSGIADGRLRGDAIQASVTEWVAAAVQAEKARADTAE